MFFERQCSLSASEPGPTLFHRKTWVIIVINCIFNEESGNDEECQNNEYYRTNNIISFAAEIIPWSKTNEDLKYLLR